MKRNIIWRRTGMILSLFLLIGFSGCKDDDDDPIISFDKDELYEDLTETDLFSEWDEDDDKVLDSAEYVNSSFDIWDINDDNTIDEGEFDEAVGDFNITGANFDDWEMDDNNELNLQEFGEGISSTTLYNDWDLNDDDQIDDREYADGVFDSWDLDDDDSIGEEDYNNLFDRYF